MRDPLQKVVITCALTGNLTKPGQTPHLPITPAAIAESALSAAQAGAAIVHIHVRRMAHIIYAAGVRPEVEMFDSGDIELMQDMLADGSLRGPILCSFVLGVKYGFQPSPETILYARNLLPPHSQFTAICIGRWMFPTVALSYLAGGHVRVGMEDGIYLTRGVLASSNAVLVEKARRIVEDLGGEAATPDEARAIVGLTGRLH